MTTTGNVKFYITDEFLLKHIAKDFNLELEYLKKGVGKGYCCINGKSLQVFTQNSSIDLYNPEDDFTEMYVTKQFVL